MRPFFTIEALFAILTVYTVYTIYTVYTVYIVKYIQHFIISLFLFNFTLHGHLHNIVRINMFKCFQILVNQG